MNIVVTYCERVHTGITGEPLNTASNLAYILAAWLLYRNWRQLEESEPAYLIFITLLTLLGMGSMAFHALPAQLTLLLDVVPIFMLMLFFCCLIQIRLLHHSLTRIIPALLILLGSTVYLSTFGEILNGSLMYLPALLYCVLAIVLLKNVCRIEQLTLAVTLLIAALIVRTIDNGLCAHLPVGTHFLWHLLTAAACYIAASSVLEQSRCADNVSATRHD